MELYQHAVNGVARAGLADLPTQIRGRTNRPIVLAYKFLSPRHSVSLSILHHEEIQTMQSVVDTALYQVLVVKAQRMHVLSMILQSSQRQYMAVQDVPKEATIWSLRVNSLSAQPARGDDGKLLVPLLVGVPGESNEGVQKTSVELTWMTKHPALGENGTISLSPPQLDMPTSALSIELQFPDEYLVNFTGSLKQVKLFSHKLPHAKDFHSTKPKASAKASLPKQGARYRFEKILVVGSNAILQAIYAVNRTEVSPQSWW